MHVHGNEYATSHSDGQSGDIDELLKILFSRLRHAIEKSDET